MSGIRRADDQARGASKGACKTPLCNEALFHLGLCTTEQPTRPKRNRERAAPHEHEETALSDLAGGRGAADDPFQTLDLPFLLKELHADTSSLSAASTASAPPKRTCKTPGCTKPDFHPLGHSFEEGEDDGPRKARPTVFDGGVSAAEVPKECFYDSTAKAMHRLNFLTLVGTNGEGDLLYLDEPSGRFTSFLLSNGVAARRLVACNWTPSSASALRDRFCPSGVRVLCDDICAVAQRAAPRSYLAIWYDMECESIPLGSVLHASTWAAVSLSSRHCLGGASEKARQLEFECSTLGVSDYFTRPSAYKGGGGIRNMVYTLFKCPKAEALHKKSKRGPTKQTLPSFDAKQWLYVPLAVPVEWLKARLVFQKEDYATTADGERLVATVVDWCAQKKGLVLAYQTADGEMRRDLANIACSVPVELAEEWRMGRPDWWRGNELRR